MKYLKRIIGLPFFLMLNIIGMAFMLFKLAKSEALCMEINSLNNAELSPNKLILEKGSFNDIFSEKELAKFVSSCSHYYFLSSIAVINSCQQLSVVVNLSSVVVNLLLGVINLLSVAVICCRIIDDNQTCCVPRNKNSPDRQ